jgi:hypothetical protein
MRFSRKTLRSLADLLEVSNGHSGLSALFFEFQLDHADSLGSKAARAIRFVKALEEKCEAQTSDASVFELIERSLRDLPSGARPNQRVSLETALELDGFEFANDKLIATTPEPAALAPQISALESELKQRGFEIALKHYQQAVDNFTRGNPEAANSQLRPFVEDLFVMLCKGQCPQNSEDAGNCLQHMRATGKIDDAEWNTFRSFWHSVQDKGPHRGLSPDEEALYRLHVATAIARYLLAKLT